MSLANTWFHLSRVSSNKKTGPIAVTTTSKNSCPASCGMREVCYAASGPLALHWAAVSNGSRSSEWRKHLNDLESLPFGSPLRLNREGSLPFFIAQFPAAASQGAEITRRVPRPRSPTPRLIAFAPRPSALIFVQSPIRQASSLTFTSIFVIG